MIERAKKNVKRKRTNVSLCTMKSVLIFYVNTKFHLRRVFFFITCAIRRGELIPSFLFTENKNKMRWFAFFQTKFGLFCPLSFFIHSMLSLFRCTSFGMPWVDDKFACAKKKMSQKMIMVMMKLCNKRKKMDGDSEMQQKKC